MVIANVVFKNNQASQNGGAIYLACDETNFDCITIFNQTMSLQDNFARISGGGLFWNDVEPQYEALNETFSFQNNSALIYGNDIACFAEKLVNISFDEYQAQQSRVQNSSLRNLQTSVNTQNSNGSLSDIRSGGSLPTMYIALADKYDQIVGTDDSSKLTISIDQQSISNQSVYSPSVDGTFEYYALMGVYIVDSAGFTGTPGQNYTLLFSTNGIDMNKPSNKMYAQTYQNNSSLISFNLQISLRYCLVGEQFTDIGRQAMVCFMLKVHLMSFWDQLFIEANDITWKLLDMSYLSNLQRWKLHRPSVWLLEEKQYIKRVYSVLEHSCMFVSL